MDLIIASATTWPEVAAMAVGGLFAVGILWMSLR